MNETRSLWIPVVVLVFAAAARFVAMAGFSFADYDRVVAAYFLTSSRAFIFLIQFGGIAFGLAMCIDAQPNQLRVLTIAAFLFILVSIGRYFVPIFLVSIVGDLAVGGWLTYKLEKKEPNKPLKPTP